MRAWVAPVVVGLVFAGCAGPGQTGEEPSVLPQGDLLRAFTATFHQHSRTSLEEGPPMVWTLSGPSRIMAADGQIRPAYMLDIRLGYADQHHRVYLDGDLQVVRDDQQCGFFLGPSEHAEGDVSCSDARIVRWDIAGILPPLGFGWKTLLAQDNVSYRHHGRPVEVQVSREEGSVGLVDAPDPNAWLWHPDNRAAPGDHPLVPAQIDYGLGVGAGAIQVAAELTSVEDGAPLPAIEPWRVPVAPAKREIPRFFGTADDPVFGLTITYEDALASLVSASPGAADDLANGCLVSFQAWPTRAQTRLADQVTLTASESVRFTARIADEAGRMRDWDWRYERTAFPETGPPPTGSPTDGFTHDEPSDWPVALLCSPTAPFDRVTPGQLLSTAWRLPTHAAGFPCAFRYVRSGADNVYLTEMGPYYAVAWIADDTDGPHPASSHSLVYSVAMDPATGHWAKMHLPAADMERLDEGAMREAPRALPTWDDLENDGAIRCVDPAGGGGNRLGHSPERPDAVQEGA